jgi:hypothetical protein
MPASFRRYEEWFRRTLLITVLFGAPAVLAVCAEPMKDPDVWWHLRTGQWIVEHRALPVSEPFSSYGQGKPWVAYSWLFELFLYGLYQVFGLSGTYVYISFLLIAITAAVYALINVKALNLAHAVALTTCGLFALRPLLTPRPWLFTILFFALELYVLATVRRSGRTRLLLWLPAIFILWANVHIQFAHGLFVLTLAALEPLLERLLRGDFTYTGLSSAFDKPLWLALAGSALATLCTPHPLGLYQTLFDLTRQSGVYRYLSEFQSIPFRNTSEWIVLLLAAGAIFVLGLRREARPLPYMLMLAGLFLSFHTRRDVWFVVITSLWLISSAQPETDIRPSSSGVSRRGFITLAVLAVCVVDAVALPRLSNGALQQQLAKSYPVSASRFIAERGYRGPLYNGFDWGGFLIWSLPNLPVSLDGRTNVYGDDRIEQFIKVRDGKPGWASDPELSAAGLIITPTNGALNSLLGCDPRFRKMYEDDVAAVYVRDGAE